MKYVYVVTRVVNGDSLGTPIPNLGVHSSYKKAKRHFDVIIKDRHDSDYRVLINHRTNLPPEEEWRKRYVVANKAYACKDNVTEELRLEKWRL